MTTAKKIVASSLFIYLFFFTSLHRILLEPYMLEDQKAKKSRTDKYELII